MSINKQQSCAFCKAYLFEDDDVVYCPICGAPHHRDCYNELGHCALEEFHGTEQQYGNEPVNQEPEEPKADTFEAEDEQGDVTCKICGTSYPKTAPRCVNCGAPNMSRNQRYAPFDFLGGVDKDTEIADGITADEAKKFVIVNTPRYIPKFLDFYRGKKSSWNWLAFLFPAHWLFSRKMYTGGVIAGVFALIASLFSNAAINSLYAILQLPETYTNSELFNRISANLENIPANVYVMIGLGFLITATLSIVMGVWGDLFYKKYAVNQINKIRAQGEDVDSAYRKKGGVNIFAALLCHLLLNYASLIILSFI